jgi:hypothetical protein
VFRIIFRPKRDEVPGGWIKLNNEQLSSLYPSPITSRWVIGAGHVQHVGGGKYPESLKRGHHSEDLPVDGQIILKCILRK